MRESINEPISVVWYYSSKYKRMQPYMLNWNNRAYYLDKIDFWHRTWLGKSLIHHFSLASKDGEAYFKIAFNSDSLQWVLEEYMCSQDNFVTCRRSL